jgi:hypothetical protein
LCVGKARLWWWFVKVGRELGRHWRHERDTFCAADAAYLADAAVLKQLPNQAGLLVGSRPNLNRSCDPNGTFSVQSLVDPGNGLKYVPHVSFDIRSIRMKLHCEPGLFNDFVGAFDFFSYGYSRANGDYLYFGKCFHVFSLLHLPRTSAHVGTSLWHAV